jgi:hypothetical protein
MEYMPQNVGCDICFFTITFAALYSQNSSCFPPLLELPLLELWLAAGGTPGEHPRRRGLDLRTRGQPFATACCSSRVSFAASSRSR